MRRSAVRSIYRCQVPPQVAPAERARGGRARKADLMVGVRPAAVCHLRPYPGCMDKAEQQTATSYDRTSVVGRIDRFPSS